MSLIKTEEQQLAKVRELLEDVAEIRRLAGGAAEMATTSVRVARRMGASEENIWATTMVQIAGAAELDLDAPGGLLAVSAIVELAMLSA
jgi:hypothetical protein